MAQKPFTGDRLEYLEIIIASLKVMESTLLGMKQVRQYVGEGVATEILDSLIRESESEISAIKRRVKC